MIEETENKVRQMLNEADEKVKKASEELENLKKETQIFKAKLKSMLSSQLQILENIEQDT